ncbi:MAG: tetratricopeptide repeat protein [Planctomycetes bacterium]|nr:tetratricopeptide repeat protein [Planctomycetota bacterium]
MTVIAAVFASLLMTAVAPAQDADVRRELQRLHDRLSDGTTVVSSAEAQAALGRLEEWNLPAAAASAEMRGLALRTEVLAALAVGHGARAVERYEKLAAAFPDQRATLETAYVLATATGNAQLGEQTLKQLGSLVDAGERSAYAQKRRRFRAVGTRAPDVTFSCEDGTEIAPARRTGGVLVIDFWNVRRSPTAAQVAGLRRLYDDCSNELGFRLVGVNAAGQSGLDEARAVASRNGYRWPQHYEQRGAGAPISHKAFRIGTAPVQVIIGHHGYICAVSNAVEPACHYAVRVALGEAQGCYPAVPLRTFEGTQVVPQTEAKNANGARAEKPEPEAKPQRPENLRDDQEAEKLLRQARLYIKTGRRRDAKALLERIIREFPGTRQAEDAKYRIEGL